MQPIVVPAFRPVLAGLGALFLAALACGDASAQSLSGSQGAAALPGAGLGLVTARAGPWARDPGRGLRAEPDSACAITTQCPHRAAAGASSSRAFRRAGRALS